MRVSVVTALAVCAVAPTALASGLPKLPVASGSLDKSQFQVKPRTIQIAGDGSFFFSGARRSHHRAGPIKWKSWTATGGRGSGFNWVNNCRPSCAQGTFHLYPVKLHAWRPKHVAGHLIFTRMTVRYTAGHPRHFSSGVYKVQHQRRNIFDWVFPGGQ